METKVQAKQGSRERNLYIWEKFESQFNLVGKKGKRHNWSQGMHRWFIVESKVFKKMERYGKCNVFLAIGIEIVKELAIGSWNVNVERFLVE